MAPLGSLAAESTSFVGRREELAHARDLLATSRLLTLTGPGGVGKTRLALRTARTVMRAFSDGAHLVQLQDLRDPGLLPQTVAAELGLRDMGPEPMARVVEFLRDRSLLLVMDNCEHLVRPCGLLVSRVLTAAAGVRVLATSRDVLRVYGEHLLAVRPLPVPEPSATRVPGAGDAVTLLAHRAASVDPGFEVGPANLAAVTAICRLLDGIPLAIELVAARMRTLSVEQVLRHLDDRFGFLSNEHSGRPSRQRTLAATVEWSHELCSPAEQAMWARLSVFSGGFTLDAAEAVASEASLEDEPLDVIHSLMDKSILIRDDNASVVRYRMLETLREFGMTKLVEAGEKPVFQRRHQHYFLDVAERFAEDWTGPEQPRVFATTRREHANLRSALDFSLSEPQDTQIVARFAVALQYYWHFGFYSEALRWLERVLAIGSLTAAVRIELLWTSTLLAGICGDLPLAAMRSQEAMAMARYLDDDYLLGTALLTKAIAALHSDDHANADVYFTRCIELFERSGRHDTKTIVAQCSHAMATTLAGDGGRAVELAQQAVRIAETFGDPATRGFAWYTLAMAEWRAGHLVEATGHAMASLRVKLGHDDEIIGRAMLVELLAWIAGAQHADERAAWLLGLTSRAWRDAGVTVLFGSESWLQPHQACAEQAQRTLGTQAFQAAFEAGASRDVDLDQALTDLVNEHAAATTPAGAAADTRAGQPQALTPRELQVAELIARGLTNKEIAARLLIAQRTAEGHVERILTKLGLTTRTHIAVWITQHRMQGP
ncbi:LuxR C-terminal-related transcriptional regulator [Kibdelosporangium philippinense]|uniref:LuxR C-terminal-related transcriptional regulator n=1 Tax=Kibdelosporangium philippinense TaxID=211113 RepID=A0ABS8ZGR8_9PSEU|nr:LuxR C-terminal-related transcriptional regulator [Kibdelosporangium philippinense]MCE7007021.1 LuxR C-terminal-related transcriptional regulator [Kibdelosporangium philippinense]